MSAVKRDSTVPLSVWPPYSTVVDSSLKSWKKKTHTHNETSNIINSYNNCRFRFTYIHTNKKYLSGLDYRKRGPLKNLKKTLLLQSRSQPICIINSHNQTSTIDCWTAGTPGCIPTKIFTFQLLRFSAWTRLKSVPFRFSCHLRLSQWILSFLASLCDYILTEVPGQSKQSVSVAVKVPVRRVTTWCTFIQPCRSG